MNSKKRYYYQVTLFFFTVGMSVFSFVNTIKGGEGIYVFFYWKLYTKPSGWEYSAKDYRLYGVTKEFDTIRVDNKGYSLFDKDDYFYFINEESQGILAGKNPKIYYADRIRAFATAIDVSYPEYLIVEEEFNPIDVYKNPLSYKTKVIFSTK